MITLENYELFVDKVKSKKGNEFCGLFIKLGEKKILLTFIYDNVYDYISNLTK